jgi:hypothetical protein
MTFFSRLDRPRSSKFFLINPDSIPNVIPESDLRYDRDSQISEA